jgi:hypothetical protein
LHLTKKYFIFELLSNKPSFTLVKLLQQCNKPIHMKKLLSILACFIFLASIATGQDNPGESISNAIVLSGTLPINESGTTVGYQDNYDEVCESASTAPDLVYSYSPSSNITADFDLCGSSYDTKIFIYQNSYTPGNPYACNDDYYEDDVCGLYVSLIQGLSLTVGYTYYIVIDGYDLDDYGNFLLEIREVPDCIWGVDVSCPTGAISENELCGDNDNGGCNMTAGTEVWVDVSATGGTFCGTTWADNYFRDSDWYELILTQASIVTLVADADVAILFGLISGGTAGYGGNPDCDVISGILPYEMAGPCIESTLELGVLNPGTYWFIVRMDVNVGFPCDNNYWIDFQVTPVTCIPPVSLLADNVTPTSANLSWTPVDSETSWQYVYGLFPLPIPTGSGTPTSSSSTNPITGLTPDIEYQFYVRADCGAEDYSIWAGPYTYTTLQIPATLPFSETFESWPNGWKIVNGTQTNKWAVGTAASHGGTSSAYISNNGGAANSYSLTSSSVVHLYRDISFTDGPGGYILKFWWKGQGEDCCDYMKVFLVEPSAMIVAGSQPSSGQIGVYNMSETWTEVTLNLAGSLTGYTKRLVFSWINDNSEGAQPPVAIDDISIVAFVCQPPTNLYATNITKFTADIGWTQGDVETAWEYYYGVSPLTPPAGSGTATTLNPTHLTGLTESTEYQFYVRANCGTIFSSWVGPYTFATVCGNFPVPYAQAFDGVTAPAIPLCWTVTDNNSDGVAWLTSTSNPYSAPNSMKIVSNSSLAMNDWFFSPAINLVAGNYLVIFKYRGSGPTDPEKLEVKWGTALQAAAMTGGVIFNNNNIINASYLEGAGLYTVSAPGEYYIGWHGYSDADMAYLLVDDIQIMSNTFTWTGNISTDWNNPGNWSSGVVPNQFVVVEIPAAPAGNRFPSVGSGISASCYEINLDEGASITVQAGGFLNVINP